MDNNVVPFPKPKAKASLSIKLSCAIRYFDDDVALIAIKVGGKTEFLTIPLMTDE